jgi:hypothetical protein
MSGDAFVKSNYSACRRNFVNLLPIAGAEGQGALVIKPQMTF